MSDTPTSDASQQPFGLGEPAPGSAAPAPAPTAIPPSDNEKLMAGLSWLSQFVVPAVLPVILLFSEESKKSAFTRHHAVQSLGMLAASILYELVAAIVFTILTAITAGCLGCVLWVIFFVPLAPFVYYGVLAFQGKYVEIPYLTKFLKDNRWL